MKTFLRVIEVWVPSPDGSLLEFGGGIFGAANTLRAISRFMCFGRAEGLPGRVWDAEQPVLLAELEGSTYRRSGAARAAGLGCAVGLPVFRGSALSCVVVLYGAIDAVPAAAMALWAHDDLRGADLQPAEAAYLGAATSIASAAQNTALPLANSLPGQALQRGESVCIDDLAQATDLAGAALAVSGGLRSALSWPCERRGSVQQVLTLFGAAGLPVAPRIERWRLEGTHVSRSFAHTEAGASGELTDEGRAAIDSACFSGLPAFVDAVAVEGRALSLAALPVGSDGTGREVLALYL